MLGRRAWDLFEDMPDGFGVLGSTRGGGARPCGGYERSAARPLAI